MFQFFSITLTFQRLLLGCNINGMIIKINNKIDTADTIILIFPDFVIIFFLCYYCFSMETLPIV